MIIAKKIQHKILPVFQQIQIEKKIFFQFFFFRHIN